MYHLENFTFVLLILVSYILPVVYVAEFMKTVSILCTKSRVCILISRLPKALKSLQAKNKKTERRARNGR